MRWLVEVTALGSPGENEAAAKESLHVDADTWQKALHTARAQRGEPGPMSGFSIELLDEGCRAVDPGSRTRYEVRRASASDGARASVPPPPPAPAAAAAPVAAAPAPTRATPSVPPPAASAVPRPAAQAPVSAAHPAASAAVSVAPVVAVVPTAPAIPATLRADVAANVPSQIVYKREQDATEAMPLTYREYVYNVPPSTTEAAAETLLTTQLEFVRASLERVPAGKLVNLAAVDTPIDAKPAPPPLATLSWKDWRGAPVIAFPRRGGARPAPAAPVATAPAASPVSAQHPAPAHAPAPQQPFAPAPAPAPVQPFAPAAFAAPAAPVAPAPNPFAPQAAPLPSVVIAQTPPPPPMAVPAVVAPAPLPMRAPASVPPPAPTAQPQMLAAPPVAVPAAPPPGFPVPLPPGHVVPQPFAPAFTPQAPIVRTSAPPLKTGGPNGRVRGEDLIADLFEAMHDLHFLKDALEGGEFCLALAMEKLPSQVGIVHVYDINHREFLITSTRGAGTSVLLMRRFPESDPILLSAMKKRKPLVFVDALQTEAATVERYTAVGGARSVIVAPVEQAGRFLGALEIMNPLDGQPFTEAEGNAIMYIAEQLAEFLNQRGVVTDPEKIAARQTPGA
jgi:hypothetical protein